MANEERPTITWKRDEPQRPTIQRPAPERPTIERPTIDIQQPTVQRPAPERPTITLGDTQAASPAQRPAPTPTQGRQDTGSHPGRKVDRPAHVSRLAHITTIHTNNAIDALNRKYPEETPDTLATPEQIQGGINYYRSNRHKVGYDENLQDMKKMIETSFEDRHDPEAKNPYATDFEFGNNNDE
jgi:hypothetical protein